MDELISELAMRLHIASRAVKAGRINATTKELVQGAMESIRRESIAISSSPMTPTEKTRRCRERRFEVGLCILCGVREHTPGYRTCEECRAKKREIWRSWKQRRKGAV